MKKKYDPAQGTKETTFLYRIMAGLAKDEYRRIAGERRRQKKAGVREVVKDPDFWETNYPLSCAGLKEVEQNDTFRQYSTVQNSEVKQLKRQYLPSSLRYLSEKELQERLSAIDREIIDRLVAGEKLTDIRKDFESRPENGSGSVGHRKFFESRRKAIIGRAGLEEPESWSRHDTPMKIVRLGEEQERRRKRGEAQRARRERKKFMEHGDARAQKRLHDSDNIEVEQHLLLPSVKGT